MNRLRSKPPHIYFDNISAPEPLKDQDLSFTNITNNSFVIKWTKSTQTPVDNYTITVNSSTYQYVMTVNGSEGEQSFTNLSSSTRYEVMIGTVLRNRSSDSTATKRVYTSKFCIDKLCCFSYPLCMSCFFSNVSFK